MWLIDAGVFKEHLLLGAEFLDEDTLLTVVNILDCEPTIYTESLRPKGRWVLVKPRRMNRNATYKCTVCGKLRSSYYNDVQEWKYCPCGAKMEV